MRNPVHLLLTGGEGASKRKRTSNTTSHFDSRFSSLPWSSFSLCFLRHLPVNVDNYQLNFRGETSSPPFLTIFDRSDPLSCQEWQADNCNYVHFNKISIHTQMNSSYSIMRFLSPTDFFTNEKYLETQHLHLAMYVLAYWFYNIMWYSCLII